MKHWKVMASCGLCLMLSGCALLPAEEEYGMAPVTQKYEAASFQTTYVTRGEVLKTQMVNCTYLPVKSEDLYFQVSGYKIEDVNVLEGQSVQAGELLAQLDLGTLEEDIAGMENRVETVNLQIAHLKENYDLRIERIQLENAQNKAALQENLEAAREEFEKNLQALSDQAYLLDLQLKDLERQKSQRQIFAPSDGTITYSKKVQDGEVSSKDSRMFTLVSSTLSIFRADTIHWPLFTPGDAFEINVGRVSYPATCVDPVETLGLAAQEKIEGKSAYVYLVLDDPTAAIKDGDKGTMRLVMDERQDALRLPENTVHTAQGQSLVYYEDENGLRAYKFIETGLEGDDWIEILSGVTEGEAVIIK